MTLHGGRALNDRMNQLLNAEPVQGYQKRDRITRRSGVYLYSEMRSTGLAHLYVGQSGSPNGSVYGRYCQENNLCTPRREEGLRWRGGTSLPAASQVTNAAMDELQERGVRVPPDGTVWFRNNPEAYNEWCRQAARFRAAQFRWLVILDDEARERFEAYAIRELRRQGHRLYNRTT